MNRNGHLLPFSYSTQEAVAAHDRQLDREELLEIQRKWRDMESASKALYEKRAEDIRLAYQKQVQEFNEFGRYRL